MILEKFEDLLGQTLTDVTATNSKWTSSYTYNGDRVVFTLESGERYQLQHEQNCCEVVHIVDICGWLSDLTEGPILLAEAVSNYDVTPEGAPVQDTYGNDSFTWTFYKLATNKGAVTFRWYGTSNGCYAEDAQFRLYKEKGK